MKFTEISRNFRNFTKFHEFCKFWWILQILRKRRPFSAHAPKRCYYKAKWDVFLVIFTRIAFFRKKAEIPQISVNFTKFWGISGNLVNFTKFSYFWQNGSRINKSGISEQLFKAEMVRFREHFPNFVKFQLFARKTLFPWKSGLGAEIPAFLVQNAFCRFWASKKPPRSLCL